MDKGDRNVQLNRMISVGVLCMLCIVFCIAGKGLWGRGENGNESLSKETVKSVSRSEECLGTVVTMTLYGSDEDSMRNILEDAFDNCNRMELIYSAKREDSELSQLNRTRDMQVSDELRDMILYGIEYGQLTDGALDIGLGRLIGLWGIGSDDPRLPSQQEIVAALPEGGYRQISVEGNHISINDDSVMIDLGAIAKGYAAQRIKEQIQAADPSLYAMLDFGGNIVTVGSKNGRDWVIGITDPNELGSIGMSVNVNDLCVVTSGNYERYFTVDGVRYHHILDPSTGYPADAGIVSSTIIGPDSWQCDALSTACYIMGVDRALELIEGIDEVEAIFVDPQGNISFSSGIDKYDLKIR